MGEMKKIVVESLPVDELPEGLESGKCVRVTVEENPKASGRKHKLRDLLGAAPGRYADPEDIVREVRELRGEWDDR